MKHDFKKSFILGMAAALTLSLGSLESKAQDYIPHTMRSTPDNGLNIDWPVLKHRQYFSYKGINSHVVTLRSLIAFDCSKIMDMYDEDPQLALDNLEMIILVQFALRGLDIQTMDPSKREDIATAEISKRLRQFGRIAETKAWLATPRTIPSVAGLCHILDEHRTDMLRQKYHVEHQWDKHKTG